MMTDFAVMESPQSDVQTPRRQAPRPDRQGAAGLVTAGAITALLSGDVRLAVRATRLLIDDDKTNSRPEPQAPRATRFRRAWSRR